MTATLWISLVLGLGGALGALFTFWTKVRDRNQDKAKKTGEIRLDQASYDEIASKAAQINSQERIETERWWKEQFDAVKEDNKEIRTELDTEKKWRQKVTRRLRDHQEWDHQAANRYPDLGVPPIIVDEGDEML